MRQYTVTIYCQTMAENAAEAARIAQDQVADGSAYAAVSTLDNSDSDEADIGILARPND